MNDEQKNSKQMNIKKNIYLRKIGDEHIMVTQTGEKLNYSRVISLNESAAFLVEQSGNNEFTVTQWATLLMNKYGIDRKQACLDAQALIDALKDAGVIENDE